jgi:hypothetical protein
MPMKNLYGYLFTGWIFAVLFAWKNREAQHDYALATRFAVAGAWIIAWPLALAVALIAAIVNRGD